MNINAKLIEIEDRKVKIEGSLLSLESAAQNILGDVANQQQIYEREIDEKTASMNEDNFEEIMKEIEEIKSKIEKFKNHDQSNLQNQVLKNHEEKSQLASLKEQVTQEYLNYTLLKTFSLEPARGRLIHDPVKRASEENKIESYYAQTGATTAPINPLETFFNSADLLQKFKDTHHPDFKVHVSYDLDEIDFNYNGNSIKMYKNCIVDPPNIKPEDRATVYGAMVDLMMTYAPGNNINHHITIADPANKEIFTRMLAERIQSKGLNQTIDGKSPAEILSPTPELESQAPKLN